jgi:predicted transcriptional regulator
MAPEHQSPTDAELRLLDELWKSPGQTVRELAVALHGDPSAVQYRTVQVLLDRLEKKRLVTRDRGQVPHRFAPAVDRARFLGEELQQMADKVCDGALAPLLLNLAERTRLSAAEKDELLRLLADDDDDDDDDKQDREREREAAGGGRAERRRARRAAKKSKRRGV